MSRTQSQPLHARSAYRLRQRQVTDLADIWEGTTRHAPPTFILQQALALTDFREVRNALLITMKKYCQLDGNLDTSRLIGYFRGVIQHSAEKRSNREQAGHESCTIRIV